MSQFDFLVVGQGIAGSLLAWELDQRGHRVAIIDQYRPGVASRVASGMWNPITFRLLLKSWRTDALLPVAMAYYKQLCQHFQGDWLHNMPIHRVFPNAAAREMWQKKQQEADYGHLLGKIGDSEPSNILPYPHGYGEVLQSGWLEINPLLDALRSHFEAKNAFYAVDFQADQLQFRNGTVGWEGLTAKKIIFAEGSSLAQNPWFQWLPLKPAQGDVLTLHIPGLALDTVYNAGFFLLPLGNDHYRLGATYEWEVLDPHPTATGKKELLNKLASIYTGPYTIVDHQAGIRPAVADRRPLLGAHPEQPEICIFNGLGTKGVLIAPYFAQQMADFLEEKGEIDAEVNINRFRKRYRKDREARQEL